MKTDEEIKQMATDILDKTCGHASNYRREMIISSMIDMYKACQEQKKVDVEELRTWFYELLKNGSFNSKDGSNDADWPTVFNFFLPHIQPAESDAIKFANWLIQHHHPAHTLGPDHSEYYWYKDLSSKERKDFKSTTELYLEFKNQKH